MGAAALVDSLPCLERAEELFRSFPVATAEPRMARGVSVRLPQRSGMRNGPDSVGGMGDRPGEAEQKGQEPAAPADLQSLARAAAPPPVPLSPAIACRYTKSAGLRFTKRALADVIFHCRCGACRDAVAAAIVGDRPARLELVDRWELLCAPPRG